MKNVKVILISVALCATVFANSRIDALGGDEGFWAGDRANIGAFPATINDHQFLEIDEVGNGDDGVDATLLWGDATKWGFNFTGADDETWFNIMWGNGDVGLNVAYKTSDWCAGNPDDDDNPSECTGFDVGYGQNFDWGELGVGFTSWEDASSYWANWRADMDAWVFDSAKASMTMSDNGASGDDNHTSMTLGFDLFTHLDAGAADILFGLGVDYASWDQGSANATWMSLPSATIAVESALNDWATLRAYVNHVYQFSCSNEDGDDDGNGDVVDEDNASVCTHDAAGPMAAGNTTSYGFGLGFNWGSASLDMQIGEEIFTDPITVMSGRDHTDDLSKVNTEVTLSYSF